MECDIMKNLEVEIIDLDHFGRGIAKTDKPIFVENSLIGEVVKIKITKEKKKYLEAQVIKFIKTSPYRVNSKCPYYDKCGGCDLLHMDYHEQLKYKEKKVREIIKKFSGLECVKKIVPSVQFNYRSKVTLHVNKKIGYYQRKSYEIVAIGNCLIADVKINNLIENEEEILNANKTRDRFKEKIFKNYELERRLKDRINVND